MKMQNKIRSLRWMSVLLATGILAVSGYMTETCVYGSTPDDSILEEERIESGAVYGSDTLNDDPFKSDEEAETDDSEDEKSTVNHILIQAHAGASVIAPENTLAAFRAAKDLGADGIETDVRMTKDGFLVLCHNDSIEGFSSGHGTISEMTLAELKELDFGSWFDEKFAGEQILTLEECLEAASDLDFKIVNLELKPTNGSHREYVEAAADTIMRSGFAGQIIVSSFDRHLLKDIKEYAPEISVGMITVPNMSAISMFHLADYLPEDKPLSAYTTEDVKSLPAAIANAFSRFGAHGNTPEEIYLELVRAVAAVVPDDAVWSDVEELIMQQADLVRFIENLDFPVDYLHCHYNTLSDTVITTMHEQGIGVNVWTPDQERDIRKVLELHADGMITDEPSLVRNIELEAG